MRVTACIVAAIGQSRHRKCMPVSAAGPFMGGNSPRKGSADQFRQLLSNLVVNARDSLHPGGKLIIKTQQVLASDGLHGWVKLSVADTGSGIARDLQKSMFEPFVSTKGEKGTGLGLWIVKGIVENHNGRIRVRSRAGKGTVFSLTFPVVRPVPDERLG